MKKLLLLLLCVPLIGLGEDCDDIITVNGIVKLKYDMKPFTGHVQCGFESANYKNGVKHGRFYYYSTGLNSKILEKGYYIDGQKDGIWEAWHLNGVLKSKGKYSKGKKIGTWEYYDVSGNPVDSDDFDVTHPHFFPPPVKEEKSKMMDFLDTYKYPLLICLVLILLIYLLGRSTSNDKEIDNNQNRQNKETEHDQYKTSKNSNLSIEKLECNNSNDIERQYNTYNRRFKDRIYTKKMFSNKIDILNKEIEKLKRLNKIPKDYPLFEVK